MQLERARGAHPDEAVDGVRAVLRVLVLFALVTPFWSLFDQKASTWVLQANAMTQADAGSEPSQMQALNPLLVMLLIPFNNLVLYPALRALRLRADGAAPHGARASRSPACPGSSVGVHAARASTAATPLSIAWQILPYALLTFGEVLVSATGLEFAYSQAPPAMKGAIMGFWSLSVTVGNLWVLLVNAGVRNDAVTGAHRADRAGRDRVPDVLLRRLRVRRRAGLRRCTRGATRCGPLPRRLTSRSPSPLRSGRGFGEGAALALLRVWCG